MAEEEIPDLSRVYQNSNVGPPDAPPEAPDAIQDPSLAPSTTGDSPTAQDELGYSPYARALAEFLLNPETKGPLTISVEGEWGSGKSSFMMLLEACLTKASKSKTDKKIPHNVPVIARFNPWRYDNDEALWAAFAVGLTKDLVSNLEPRDRWMGHLRRFTARFDWKHGWIELLKAATAFVVATVLLIALLMLTVQNGPSWLPQFTEKVNPAEAKGANWFTWLSGFGFFGTLAGYAVALLAIASKVQKLLTTPIQINLRKHLRSPDYASRVSFIEEFHEDFGRVIDAYAKNKMIFAFIDDLDRTTVPRAAELMQAINLMISTNRKNIVFILGMDREKIASGLAVKFESLLPYLYPQAPRSADWKTVMPETGLQFGFDYIEKFVQLVFTLPKPRPVDIDRFLKSLAADRPSGSQPSDGQTRRETVGHGNRSVGPSALSPAPEAASASPAFQVRFSTDSDDLRAIATKISPFLGDNPRRLKQFVNVFRLRGFIAYETGILGPGKLTFQQLGKMVALQMLWPVKMAEYFRNGLLSSVLATNSDSLLAPLIGLGVGVMGDDWSLESVDLQEYFRVSPVVRTVDLDSVAPPAAAPVLRSTPVPRTKQQPAARRVARVLWVDNEPSNNSDLLEAMRQRFQVEFSISPDTEDALRQTAEGRFDLIISDLGRPGDSLAGFTLLTTLRQKGNTVPYLIFSLRGDQYREEAIRRGALNCTNSEQVVVDTVASIARAGEQPPQATAASMA
jgi:CheY-like chemotaxis protein